MRPADRGGPPGGRPAAGGRGVAEGGAVAEGRAGREGGGVGEGRPGSARGRRAGPRVPAERDPVAGVVVDAPLAHLDRPFDYLVPADLDEQVVAGSRVRVRFAGQQMDGTVLDRVASSDHSGVLAYVTRSVSPEPVLNPEVARLARAVADRYAGSLPDVLRLAVPTRHARVERETPVRTSAPAPGVESGPPRTAPGVGSGPPRDVVPGVGAGPPRGVVPGAGSGPPRDVVPCPARRPSGRAAGAACWR